MPMPKPFYVDYQVQELWDEYGEPIWVNDAVIVLLPANLGPGQLEQVRATFPKAFDRPPDGCGEIYQSISQHRDWPYDLTPDSLTAFLQPTPETQE